MEPIVRQRVRTFWDKGEERLKAARLLYQQGFYEEAVSVAYYATLWAARALLLTEGAEPRTHEGVRTMLGLYFIRTGRLPQEVGRLFTRRLDDRMSADYSDAGFLSSEDAEEAIAQAERFLEALRPLVENYLQEGDSGTISP
ncbi:MAG: HEPN domain-containing protein [Armatimonadota bacterium]|nr:MAG: HEPN domain-containing protein [Armatimonadota bacterium]